MHPTRSRTRGRPVLLTLSCLATAVVVVAGLAGARPGHRPTTGPGAVPVRADGAEPGGRPAARASAVLHAWDARRARAWSDGDVVALRALYVPGSRAGERDVAMLEAWLHRGLRVRGLSTQLLGVRVGQSSADRLVLSVTDRVAGFAAAPGAAPVALPADRPTRRTVVLERQGDRWRVAAVHP